MSVEPITEPTVPGDLFTEDSSGGGNGDEYFTEHSDNKELDPVDDPNVSVDEYLAKEFPEDEEDDVEVDEEVEEEDEEVGGGGGGNSYDGGESDFGY